MSQIQIVTSTMSFQRTSITGRKISIYLEECAISFRRSLPGDPMGHGYDSNVRLPPPHLLRGHLLSFYSAYDIPWICEPCCRFPCSSTDLLGLSDYPDFAQEEKAEEAQQLLD